MGFSLYPGNGPRQRVARGSITRIARRCLHRARDEVIQSIPSLISFCKANIDKLHNLLTCSNSCGTLLLVPSHQIPIEHAGPKGLGSSRPRLLAAFWRRLPRSRTTCAASRGAPAKPHIRASSDTSLLICCRFRKNLPSSYDGYDRWSVRFVGFWVPRRCHAHNPYVL